MIRKFVVAITGCLLVLVSAPRAHAQVSKGYSDVGVVLGFGNLAGANIAFGGRYENVFKKLPDLGDGLLGFELSADVYNWNTRYATYRYVPIGATMNYHFPIDPKNKVDLFLGAGLGVRLITCALEDGGSFCSGYNTGLYVIGRAGGRYFFSPRTSLYADLGAGAATINIGLAFKLK